MNKKQKKSFMDLAEHYSKRSGDPHKKVGALLIGHYPDKIISIVSEGYNHLPKKLTYLGYKNEEDRTRPEVIHAEAHAIQRLMQQNDFDNKGYELFCTLSPCMECAKLIYMAGIKAVYYKEHWKDQAPLEFLRINGIKTEQII